MCGANLSKNLLGFKSAYSTVLIMMQYTLTVTSLKNKKEGDA